MNEIAEKIMNLKVRLEELTGELDQYEKIALVLAVKEQAYELITARRNLEQLIDCINSIVKGEDGSKGVAPLISPNTTGILH